jgi:hypothetical protein
MVVIADLQGFERYKKRVLAEYDAPKGKPLWLL